MDCAREMRGMRSMAKLNRQNHVGVGHHRGAIIEDGDILESRVREPDLFARA
jgi:hypothetical protein